MPVTVLEINPGSGSVGLKDKKIEITGTKFADGAGVAFSGTNITVSTITVESPQKISAYITVGQDAEATARNLTVTNTNGNFGTKEAAFLVLGAPSRAPQGATGRHRMANLLAPGSLELSNVNAQSTKINANQ